MNPLKVKIFTHCTCDIKPYNEMQINEWLQSNSEITIVHLLQSESMAAVSSDRVDRNLTITVFYTESGRSS
jgi:hypothetical protein